MTSPLCRLWSNGRGERPSCLPQSSVRLLLQFLAEPRHGPLEMMEVEAFDAWNVVILHPRRAVTVRPRDEKTVQSADKDSAFDCELERAVLQQLTEHVADAEPFPYPAEQQRAAVVWRDNDPSASWSRAVDEQHLVGEFGTGGQQ